MSRYQIHHTLELYTNTKIRQNQFSLLVYEHDQPDFEQNQKKKYYSILAYRFIKFFTLYFYCYFLLLEKGYNNQN